jgi:sRNA-binding protein
MRHHVGEHWSGANPVPTVQKFMQHLDEEKKERDQRIDAETQAKNKARTEEAARKKEKERRGEDPNETDNTGDVNEHKPREVSQAKIRTVTDPTTGKDIGVEDQDEDSMETVKNPTVRIFGLADTNTSLT